MEIKLLKKGIKISRIEKIEKEVENYINGNISDFKKFLESANKKEILLTVKELSLELDSDDAIDIVLKYLEKE